MKSSKKKIIGWTLSALIAAFLTFASASGKFTEWEGKEELFAEMGWSTEIMFKIGFVEVLVALLFLVPKIAIYGAILLTAYLGGATATHIRMGEAFYMPIVIGILVWIALAFRDPSVFKALLSKRPESSTTSLSNET
ncbi:DoxX family protein [Pelagicoccus sp. SDUM812002]|uniref:DoxX family protein n=1 Tax=Pelagicoccus sp. SDUM812002 TaxID=3041266 RepID=UPI00280FE4D7|nr:DoxX family protein [Pelagicoccus sp. SDUM812002]MDQ8184015.1 DoxX family protein [Pelagicoccus sp. SDUM812002]